MGKRGFQKLSLNKAGGEYADSESGGEYVTRPSRKPPAGAGEAGVQGGGATSVAV